MSRRVDVHVRGEPRIIAPGVVLHAFETPASIAVLQGTAGPLAWSPDEDALVGSLIASGWSGVACVRAWTTGASVARARAASEHVDDVAAAVWGLSALCGWDETPVLGIALHDARSSNLWIARNVDAPRVVVGAMRGPDACRAALERTRGIVVADVDHLGVYNDAYGHERGDLALARIAACVTEHADAAGADTFRIAGATFAGIAPTRGTLASLAESIRAGVEALAIPLEHPEIRTPGRLTVTCWCGPSDDLRSARDALLDAKPRGRNRVHALA